VRCFCADLTASQTAPLLSLKRKTVNRSFGRFRVAIAAAQERDLAAFSSVVEVDESFFGAKRLRGHPGPTKRGRGTLKRPVFGIIALLVLQDGRLGDNLPSLGLFGFAILKMFPAVQTIYHRLTPMR
jgi:hypothetical protein